MNDSIKPWKGAVGIPSRVTFEPKGYRDVMWCEYLNEPAILEWRDGEPYCSNCERELDLAAHPFICHVLKRA